MKKIFIVILFLSFLFINANATQVARQESMNDTIYFQILEVNNTTLELLVYATSTVSEFCDKVSSPEISVPIGLICAFTNAGNPVCYIYGAMMAACAVNEAVKLTLEGDFTRAVLSAVGAGTKVYKMSKVDFTTYKIE